MDWYEQDADFQKLQLSDEQIKELASIYKHFKLFDKDNSGIIDTKEFNRFYDDLKTKVLIYRRLYWFKGLAKKSKFNTLREMDLNRDGIKFYEYVKWHFGAWI